MTEAAAPAEAPVTEQEKPRRTIGDWYADQTTLSLTAGVLGAVSLSLLLIGTPIVITSPKR
jgi:hypothetical protein